MNAHAAKPDIRDVVGCTHVAGKYNFTDKDYLNEGADELLRLGTRVIKLWLTPNPARDYPFNSTWTKPASMLELAKTPYYQDVFAKPFSTFILEAFAPGHDDGYFKKGMTPKLKAKEQEDFYQLAKYLLTKYKGTGKTFILQNWESDWMLTSPGSKDDPDPVAVQGMIDWLNARQDGIEQARAEVGMHGVKVYLSSLTTLRRSTSSPARWRARYPPPTTCCPRPTATSTHTPHGIPFAIRSSSARRWTIWRARLRTASFLARTTFLSASTAPRRTNPA